MNKIKLYITIFIILNIISAFAFCEQKNVSSNNENFQNVTFNTNDIYNKFKLTQIQARNFIIIGGVLTGCSTLFMSTSVIMGLVPYRWLPDEMKVYDSFIYGDSSIWRIDYPYLTAYGATGATLLASGAMMFLFALPVLIYGCICYYEYNKIPKISVDGSSISIKLGKTNNKRKII